MKKLYTPFGWLEADTEMDLRIMIGEIKRIGLNKFHQKYKSKLKTFKPNES